MPQPTTAPLASRGRPTSPRGVVVVLGGRREGVERFAEFAGHLSLNGYRVEVVPDVSRDPESVLRGVDRILSDPSLAGPRFVFGSDAGGTLAAHLATSRLRRLDALVLSGLATRGVVSGTTGERVRLPQAERIGVPTLVLHGDADPVTDVADLASWAASLKNGSIRLVRGGGHDVLDGEARLSVFAAVVLFLERQRAQGPVFSQAFG